MFKKKPQIKNLSPLRSSDRRKLADQVIADYQIPVPAPQSQPQQDDADPATSNGESTQPTLSSIRTSLLPESTSSARFTTTSGPNATLVSGTVYVGTHPGSDERVLWFQIGKDPKCIPTVYTLWHNPNIVPLVHAPDFVAEEKLRAGADMMIPGLVKARGMSWDERATKGSVIAVAGISRDTVPLWIGTAEVDIAAFGDDLRGQKGVAIKGLHWEGDELWSWSTVSKGGRHAPDAIEGWTGLMDGIGHQTEHLDIDDDNEDHEEEHEDDGGVSLESSTPALNNGSNGHAEDGAVDGNDAGAEEEPEPTTQEVDQAFHQAFLYAIYNAKKSNSAPNYGLDFPIQPSYLVANMIQPHLRVQNSPHYAIKKTSWKNVKKFIKHLDKSLLVKSKDRNGGETVILDIDFNDQQIKDFTPYRLPTPKPANTSDTNGTTDSSTGTSSTLSGADSSLNQKLTIQTLYRASSKLVPDLLPSKTSFYSSAEISTALKSYIESDASLTQKTSSPRYIKLNPFIANNILSSNSSQTDTKILAAGEIGRDVLLRRILEDDHLAQPYHIILRNDQKFDSSSTSSSDLKPRPGSPPKVTITIEKRTGTKVVTKLSNLEPFYIHPQLLAPELQKKCAGSASVGQLVGGKPGLMEIVIQGDQRDVLVRDVLAKRGVAERWIDIVDKVKGKKKK